MRLERIPWVDAEAPSEAGLRAVLEREGFAVWGWSDAPGVVYAAHHHDHDESIWVVGGTITFGAGGASYRLDAGDRLMLPRGTVHTASVGPAGASYLVGER